VSAFSPRRAEFSGRISVAGEIERVFRLFSPLGERAWVPGWEPELLDPPGMEWTEGLVFRTREQAGDVLWIVSRLDRAAHRVAYHRVEPERHVARVEVACRSVAARSVAATVTYSYVGLSERGNRDIAAMTARAYEEKLSRWTQGITACLDAEEHSGPA
jgi:hypothetical protein